MIREKILGSPSGFIMLFVFLALLGLTAWLFSRVVQAQSMGGIIGTMILLFAVMLIPPGLIVVQPNEAKALVLFGRYHGSVKEQGFRWVAMVSNLLVVPCGERGTQPVVNAGTLYAG